jgi:hypothetical protein
MGGSEIKITSRIGGGRSRVGLKAKMGEGKPVGNGKALGCGRTWTAEIVIFPGPSTFRTCPEPGENMAV